MLVEAWQPHDPTSTERALDELAPALDIDDLRVLQHLIHEDHTLHHVSSRLASKYFVRRAAAAPTLEWIAELTSWLARLLPSEDRFLIASSDVTWALRQAHHPLLNALPLSTVFRSQETDHDAFKVQVCLLLQSARYDFNFELIERLLSAAGHQLTESSPYFKAMHQFSRMGNGRDIDRRNIVEITSNTDSEKILSLLLHGLWFTTGSDEADLMLDIADRLTAVNPYDPVTLMRRAAAFRRRGDYEDAVASINRAISLLPPNEYEMHSDFKLERVTISIQQDASERLSEAIVKRVDDASATLETRIEAIISTTRNELSDSLFKVVEILGIFTAIIAVVATVVGTANADGTPWQARVLTIMAGGFMIIGFFALLRWIVRPRQRRESAGD